MFNVLDGCVLYKVSYREHTQMCTWLYRCVSCQNIIEVKIGGDVFGLLPEPEALPLHHHGQNRNGIIQAGHRDQQPSMIHLLHEVPGGCGEHVSAGNNLSGWHNTKAKLRDKGSGCFKVEYTETLHFEKQKTFQTDMHLSG